MINICGSVSTQVPKNPGQWLRDWSKQIKSQVMFEGVIPEPFMRLTKSIEAKGNICYYYKENI